LLNIARLIAEKMSFFINGCQVSLWRDVSSRLDKQGGRIGFWICVFLTFLSLIFMMLFPFTPMQTSTWPLAVLFALMIVSTFFGCGNVCRGRPQFQFHYHGEHTVVMDEIGAEVIERDLVESKGETRTQE
jgi:hypothetical protein